MGTVLSVTMLGDWVRRTRRALTLTQSELALVSGVGVRFIVDLEAGKPTVRLGLVLQVIEALGGKLQLLDAPAVQPLAGDAHGT